MNADIITLLIVTAYLTGYFVSLTLYATYPFRNMTELESSPLGTTIAAIVMIFYPAYILFHSFKNLFTSPKTI